MRRTGEMLKWLGLVGLCLAGAVVDGRVQEPAPPAVSGPATRAFEYLSEQMDATHSSFWIYRDVDSGANHYYPSRWLNGATNMKVDPAWRQKPFSGDTCIRIEWDGKPGKDTFRWNGLQFTDSPTPEGDLGTGYDLSRAVVLRGRVRTETPGMRIQTLVSYPEAPGGVTGDWTAPLHREWGAFEVSLEGRQERLNPLQVPLTVVFNDFFVPDPKRGCVVYLDELEVVLSEPARRKRLDEPRLLASFSRHPDVDVPANRCVSYTYDVAIVALAYLARGTPDDVRRARILGDGLLRCQEQDRAFSDGRLRNGMLAGDLELHPGDKVRLPGWWDPEAGAWREDRFQVSSHLGNTCWAGLAFLTLHDRTGDAQYLSAAVKLGEWILKNCQDKMRPDGFIGGWEGWEARELAARGRLPVTRRPTPQVPAAYKSTEMCLDAIPFFARLYQRTGNRSYLEACHSARRLVLKMYQGGRFVTGTRVPTPTQVGDLPNPGPTPLDVNTWAVLVLGATPETRAAMRWAQEACRVNERERRRFDGFDFNADDRDAVWVEGTGQAILALRMLGQEKEANHFLSELRRIQASCPGGDGKGLVAATRDRMTTGFKLTAVSARGELESVDWLYYRQMAIAGTAWFLYSELDYNPYWDCPTDRPVPVLPDL